MSRINIPMTDELRALVNTYAAHAPRTASEGQNCLVALDLDRTLIYSAKALALGMDDHDAPALLVAEVYERAPLSFITADAVALLQQMTTVATLVPATTRTRAQYRRISLPFACTYAITTNGGHLLVDGKTDDLYHRAVLDELEGSCEPLGAVREHLKAISDPAWLRKLRDAEDLFAYLVVERAELPRGLVDDLSAWADERGWEVSVQGRKVYVVPKPLRKSRALREVMALTDSNFSAAAGDSLLDIDMLEIVDAPVRPRHGELNESDWSRDGLVVTKTAGVMGGREVCARLLASVQAAQGSRTS